VSKSEASPYNVIGRDYERCLEHHVTGPLAVNWKSERDAAIRYDLMLGVIRNPLAAAAVLDLGCGLGGLRDHMESQGLAHLSYFGIDVSEAFVAAARRRRPDLHFEACDLLKDPTAVPEVDYNVINSVFTRREDLPERHMTDYMTTLVSRAYERARIGIAFNVMSACVDWKTDALYHPDASILTRLACRLSGHLCSVVTTVSTRRPAMSIACRYLRKIPPYERQTHRPVWHG
jgi:SAM-dependent methyltransferase